IDEAVRNRGKTNHMTDAGTSIFFSYARSDSEFVLKVATELRKDGRNVWVDQLDIPKGSRWDDEVEKALKASTCLLAVLSPESLISQNVLDEVSYALEEKKRVIPILLRKCVVPFRLKRLQYVDFTADYEGAYRQLGAALDAQAPPRSAEPMEQVEQTAPAPGTASVSPPAQVPDREPGSGSFPPVADGRIASTGPAVAGSTRLVMGLIVAATVVVGVGYLGLVGRTSAPPDKNPPSTEGTKPVDAAPMATFPAALPSQAVPSQPAPDVVSQERRAQPSTLPATPSDTQLKDFVLRYIDAQNHANSAELLTFYADRVDYFDQKNASKSFILKDKQNYYRRWPEQQSHLAGTIDVNRSAGDGTITLSYPIEYRVRSSTRAESKSGAARDELRVQQTNGQLLIVAQRQRIQKTQN
ncbi:MAG: TIR domain-containing protein, partial [Propionivibrio sp.]